MHVILEICSNTFLGYQSDQFKLNPDKSSPVLWWVTVSLCSSCLSVLPISPNPLNLSHSSLPESSNTMRKCKMCLYVWNYPSLPVELFEWAPMFGLFEALNQTLSYHLSVPNPMSPERWASECRMNVCVAQQKIQLVIFQSLYLGFGESVITGTSL